MNALIDNKQIVEMQCGENFSFILKDNASLLPTEYKMLQSHSGDCFVKCMKMMYNDKIQLYYLTGNLRPFSSIINDIHAESFLTIIRNLFAAVIEVKSNGFLSIKNVDISLEKIFVNTNFKVSLVYLPLKIHVFDNAGAFENELKTSLVKLIESNRFFATEEIRRLLADLKNVTYDIETVYKHLGRSVISEPSRESVTGPSSPTALPGPTEPPRYVPAQQPAAKKEVKMVALNAPYFFEIKITKPEFNIGLKDTNDGIIPFNKAISRLHCCIVTKDGKYWVKDLKSANGTYVNKTRIYSDKLYPIKSGDIIRLANTDFRFIVV